MAYDRVIDAWHRGYDEGYSDCKATMDELIAEEREERSYYDKGYRDGYEAAMEAVRRFADEN